MRKHLVLAAVGLSMLAGCSELVTFEQKAGKTIAEACAEFRAVSDNPLIRVFGGPTVASIRDYGEAFCTYGPPPTDTTTPAQQVDWLMKLIAEIRSLI